MRARPLAAQRQWQHVGRTFPDRAGAQHRPSLPFGHFPRSLLLTHGAAVYWAGCARVTAHTRARAHPHACKASSLHLLSLLHVPALWRASTCLWLDWQQSMMFCSCILISSEASQSRGRLQPPSWPGSLAMLQGSLPSEHLPPLRLQL